MTSSRTFNELDLKSTVITIKSALFLEKRDLKKFLEYPLPKQQILFIKKILEQKERLGED